MIGQSKYQYWFIIVLLLLATSLSFLDRQILSVSILKIREDLEISDVAYGFINSGFLISYAIMFTLSGILIDRYGSRLGLAFSVGFWSFSTALHSFSGSALHFGLFRFLLGLGEGGCFPGAIRAVIEWVPKNKHALANGIAIGGSAIGAVVAPPLCVFLLDISGWREVFLITGGFGFIWLLAWLFFTRNQNRAGTQSISGLESGMVNQTVKLTPLLKNKKVAVFVIIRFILDPIFYYYMFWIPKYLNEVHELSLAEIGKYFWIPFMALGVANVFGGWLSDLVFCRTSNVNYARKVIMGVAAALTVPIVLVGFIHSWTMILVLMSLAFFAHGLWITNYITAIGDIFGQKVTSTVVGLSGSAGALSALILNPVIGYVVSNYSYGSLWWYAGSMYPVAFVLLLVFIPRIELQLVKE